MQSGLIHKLAVMPANETDTQGMKRVCRIKAKTMSTRVSLPRCTYSVAPRSAIKGCGGDGGGQYRQDSRSGISTSAAWADQPNAFLHANARLFQTKFEVASSGLLKWQASVHGLNKFGGVGRASTSMWMQARTTNVFY